MKNIKNNATLPDDSKVIEISATTLSSKRFFEGNGDTRDVVSVPDGTKYSVGKSKRTRKHVIMIITLHYHTAFSHCILTLHCHTALSRCILVPHCHTALSHCILILHRTLASHKRNITKLLFLQ